MAIQIVNLVTAAKLVRTVQPVVLPVNVRACRIMPAKLAINVALDSTVILIVNVSLSSK